MTYRPVARKGVTLGEMSARVSDDGSSVLLTVIDTPINLSSADASDLYEVLGDVMQWGGGVHHEHDEEN